MIFRAAGSRVSDKENRRLDGSSFYISTGGAAQKVLDLDTGHVRESTLKDVADTRQLVVAMDNVHHYLRAYVAHDIPGALPDINTYSAHPTP